MTITVSMPYYRAAEWVETAVRSVLAQTHTDLVCVVVGDGERPALDIIDPRLIVYNLPENHGAYFAQAVVLAANPHEWYAPHASDDWSEPDHLERLIEYDGDVATGAVWEHNNGTTEIIRKVFEVGLFRTERLRAIGGYNPAERLGQDSLTMRLLRVTGTLHASTVPTYHRMQRENSLCNHPDTQKGSPAREAMRRRNRIIAHKCERMGSIEAIRNYRESVVPPRIRDEVAMHAERLRGLLS